MIGRIAILGALAAVQAGPAPVADTFCARLAPQLGMKPDPRAPGAYRVNMLGGLGKALFGGSAAASFSVRPIEGQAAAFVAAENDCAPTPKGGVACRLSGPARAGVSTPKGEALADLKPGERAALEMRGGTITCRGGD